MPGFGMVILIVVIAAVAIGAAIWNHKQEQKRREELRALAHELGFSFDPTHDSSHDERYSHFEVFRKGHSRIAKNTLTGSIDIDGRPFRVVMGDFRYKVTRHSGKSSSTQTYRFSYVILHLPWRTPDLLIRPEHMFDKLAGVIGFDDIDFESHEFSRKYCVKSNDKRFAYDVIHPRMMEFLLKGSPTIDIEHSRCLLADGKRRWSPDEFKQHLRWIAYFFDQWPDHLTQVLDG